MNLQYFMKHPSIAHLEGNIEYFSVTEKLAINGSGRWGGVGVFHDIAEEVVESACERRLLEVLYMTG